MFRGPGFDPRARQDKEVPMNTLVCTCGSFVEFSSAFRSLSGDNLALASHPRMGQSHILYWISHVSNLTKLILPSLRFRLERIESTRETNLGNTGS